MEVLTSTRNDVINEATNKNRQAWHNKIATRDYCGNKLSIPNDVITYKSLSSAIMSETPLISENINLISAVTQDTRRIYVKRKECLTGKMKSNQKLHTKSGENWSLIFGYRNKKKWEGK